MHASSDRIRRHLALRLPFLPTDRLRRLMAGRSRAGVGPGDPPHVVFANDRGALRLTAADPAALAHGLAPGMTLADARSRAPELMASEANPAADARLLGDVALWCLRWTPLVAVAPPDCVVLDVTGASHLFGGDERLTQAAGLALARQGLHAVAALARTPSMARALAAAGVGGVLTPAREAEVLPRLPAAVLELDADRTRLLERLGLATLGLIDAQDRGALAARAGRAALDRLDAVMGRVEEPFHSIAPLPECLAERTFAHPVTEEAALLKTIGRLAGDLAEVLESRARARARYEAQMFRADGAVRRLAVETGRPTRDPSIVERLFRERLAGLADPLDPGFGFDLLRLVVTRTERFDDAPPDFAHRGAQAEAEARLIDALSTRHGAGAVLRAMPVDAHWPERAQEMLPAQQIAASLEAWPVLRAAGEPPARPIRLFDPPEPVEALAEVPDGPPARFRWRRVLHDVARAEGPERIAPEWWRGDIRARPASTRDYFRVEDGRGRRFWLFREGLYDDAAGADGGSSPRWFLHGVFA